MSAPKVCGPMVFQRHAGRPKTSLQTVLREEIEQAALWWGQNLRCTDIAERLNWSPTLLERVMRISRDCDEAYFPRRRVKAAVLQTPVEKAREVAWRTRPAGKHRAPSTVKARRPADYMKRTFVDPTLSLPSFPVPSIPSERPVAGCESSLPTAQTIRAATLSADHVPSIAASRSADVLFRRGG